MQQKHECNKKKSELKLLFVSDPECQNEKCVLSIETVNHFSIFCFSTACC